LLRFPPEPPDPLLAGCDVVYDRGSTANAVAVGVIWILKRDERLV
jgi:hypothetical protein